MTETTLENLLKKSAFKTEFIKEVVILECIEFIIEHMQLLGLSNEYLMQYLNIDKTRLNELYQGDISVHEFISILQIFGLDVVVERLVPKIVQVFKEGEVT